jgi:hypothetical protein
VHLRFLRFEFEPIDGFVELLWWSRTEPAGVQRYSGAKQRQQRQTQTVNVSPASDRRQQVAPWQPSQTFAPVFLAASGEVAQKVLDVCPSLRGLRQQLCAASLRTACQVQAASRALARLEMVPGGAG